MRLRVNQPVAMRDGVRLVDRPVPARGRRPVPDGPDADAVRQQPAGRRAARAPARRQRLRRRDPGRRGRFDSEGTYYPFRNEADDGFDTQQWIGAQPWSTGRIGMAGGSYDGWVQWSSATARPPHLSAWCRG